MPELPEAETIARGLRDVVVGARIRDVHVLHADVLREPPSAFRGALRGRAIQSVGRRGKNVVLELGEGGVLLVNLGMTGRLLPLPSHAAPRASSHPAVLLKLDRGRTLVYDDVRRFGVLERLDAAAWRARSRILGPEPLSPAFTARRLARGLATSRSPVRSWLLDQRRVAGVGNIYANEALYRARVHPRRPASSLEPDEIRRLHRALRRVLRAAVRARGTTLRDYRAADGTEGGFAPRLEAYGRGGKPCRRCGSPIQRIVFGNRPAFLCPVCQPEEGARRTAEG